MFLQTASGKSVEAAKGALHYVAPVGEMEDYIERAMRNMTRYLNHALSTA
jgi:hypothetical protein